MHEYGTDTTGLNPNWGTPRNPHNRNYYPGGSSSGSAYAVAAGLIPFAFGADGGGSIRIPAAFCGIYGLKPTHGRLEDTESTITCTGPLAATMMDLEAMYRVLAQPNPSDSICAHFAPPSTTPTSHSKVIGIYKPWFASSDKSVLDVCQKAVDYYQNKLGYEIVDIEIPYLAEGQKAHALTVLTELTIRARSHRAPNQPLTSTAWLSELNAANKVIFSVVGNQTSALDYRLAQQMRNILMQHLAYLYEKYPNMVIVTPTSPMPGWNIKSEEDLKYGCEDGDGTFRSMEYVWIANFCGNPAISVPVGYADPVKTAGEGKIPIGLMAMGDWGSEDQLLAWGREAEIYLNEFYDGGKRKPSGEGWVDVFSLADSKIVTNL
jgi:Asp-tRNA(Asn)/Glu-tRNA(Gln) amidotransferase A subunit family amidase